jgi:hypothetical protein
MVLITVNTEARSYAVIGPSANDAVRILDRTHARFMSNCSTQLFTSTEAHADSKPSRFSVGPRWQFPVPLPIVKSI